jgi:hypothetical protein
MVDQIFNWCVKILFLLADFFGITYNEINVYIFCVIWPLITVGLIAVLIIQALKIRRLKNRNT